MALAISFWMAAIFYMVFAVFLSPLTRRRSSLLFYIGVVSFVIGVLMFIINEKTFPSGAEATTLVGIFLLMCGLPCLLRGHTTKRRATGMLWEVGGTIALFVGLFFLISRYPPSIVQ